MKIETTVSTTITQSDGTVTTFSRTVVGTDGDNPRFFRKAFDGDQAKAYRQVAACITTVFGEQV